MKPKNWLASVISDKCKGEVNSYRMRTSDIPSVYKMLWAHIKVACSNYTSINVSGLEVSTGNIQTLQAA